MAPWSSPSSRVHYCIGERTVTIWTDWGHESQLWDVEKGRLVQKWKTDESSNRSFENLEADRQHFTLNGRWLPSSTVDNTASCSTLTDGDTGLLDVEGGWLRQVNDRLLCLPSKFNPAVVFTSFGNVSWPVQTMSRNSIVLGSTSSDLVSF